MKVLLLLNFEITVWHVCLSKAKREVKRVKNLTIDRVWVKKGVKQGQESYQKGGLVPKLGQKGGQKGSKIYGTMVNATRSC